jgi:hypothetical protein
MFAQFWPALVRRVLLARVFFRLRRHGVFSWTLGPFCGKNDRLANSSSRQALARSPERTSVNACGSLSFVFRRRGALGPRKRSMPLTSPVCDRREASGFGSASIARPRARGFLALAASLFFGASLAHAQTPAAEPPSARPSAADDLADAAAQASDPLFARSVREVMEAQPTRLDAYEHPPAGFPWGRGATGPEGLCRESLECQELIRQGALPASFASIATPWQAAAWARAQRSAQARAMGFAMAAQGAGPGSMPRGAEETRDGSGQGPTDTPASEAASAPAGHERVEWALAAFEAQREDAHPLPIVDEAMWSAFMAGRREALGADFRRAAWAGRLQELALRIPPFDARMAADGRDAGNEGRWLALGAWLADPANLGRSLPLARRAFATAAWMADGGAASGAFLAPTPASAASAKSQDARFAGPLPPPLLCGDSPSECAMGRLLAHAALGFARQLEANPRDAQAREALGALAASQQGEAFDERAALAALLLWQKDAWPDAQEQAGRGG